MEGMILDVGLLNNDNEFVFVDEPFYIREEIVVSGPLENKDNAHFASDLDNPESLEDLKNEHLTDSFIHNEEIKNKIEDNVTRGLSFTYHQDSSTPTQSEKDPKNLYSCFKCKQIFDCHENLANHLDSHNYPIEVKEEENGRRMWSCKKCNRSFTSRKGSVIHLRTHTGERPFSCKVCAKKFIDGSTLMKHQVIHRETRPYTCSTCYRGFNQRVALQRHESTHSLQPVFACKYCPKTFLVRSSLTAHEHIHTRAKPYICNFCPSRFQTLTLQRQHERVHTNERPYQCTICLKAFKDSGTLHKHQVIHSGVKPFSCPLCPNRFTQKVAVRKHVRTHMLKTNLKQCPICENTVNSTDELCVHLEKHVLENSPLSEKYQMKPDIQLIQDMSPDLSDLATLCDVAISTSGDYFSKEVVNTNAARGQFVCFCCGMRYKREKTLNSHLAGVHLFCIFCSLKFSDRTGLSSHACLGGKCSKKKLVSEENRTPNFKQENKQFYCEKCCKYFNSRNGFVIHQRSHTGERPYACRWCEKAFGDSATRHKHERIHTGERPFKCSGCPRAFNQRAALRAHQVMHSRDRAFLCQACPTSFPYLTTLQKHVESCHNGSVQLRCPLCDKHSLNASTLRNHLGTFHMTQVCKLCDSGVFSDRQVFCEHMVGHATQQALNIYSFKTKKLAQTRTMNCSNKRTLTVREYLID